LADSIFKKIVHLSAFPGNKNRLGGAIYNAGGISAIENCNLSSNLCQNMMECRGSDLPI
jgi:hypothetical protein